MRQLITAVLQLYAKAFSGLPARVWLLSLVMLVNRSGAMVVAFLSVYLVNARGYEPLQAGYVMAAFGAGGVVGNYVGGLLNDRYGSWHIQFYSMLGAGVLHIVLGQVSELWALCLLSFLISAVADAFRPANRAAIAIYAPREVLTQSYGLQRMAVNLGFSIGPALGGWLVYTYGYELMFWGDGLTFLLAAAVFRFALPPDETARPLVSREEREQSALTTASTTAAPTAAPPAHTQPWLLVFVLANACVMVCFFQLFSNFPVALKESGFDERAIGWLFTISGIVIVALEMPLLYVAERRLRPIPVMLAGSALIGLAFLAVPTAAALGYTALVVAIIVLTVGEIFYMPFTNTYVSTHAPPARRGEYLGILSASYSAAFVFCPLIAFRVADGYGYETATYVCSAAAFVGWLLLTRVNRLRLRRSVPAANAAL